MWPFSKPIEELSGYRRPLVHGQLLAQGDALDGELAVAAAEEWEYAQQMKKRGDNQTVILTES